MSDQDIRPSVQAIAQEGTGEPTTLKYMHITEDHGYTADSREFDQHKEPIGQFVRENLHDFKDDGPISTGVKEFERPLVIEFGGRYGSGENWKDNLSSAFDGKTGKALTRAIRDDGFDAVITLDGDGDASEIVDLMHGKGGKPLLIDDHWLLTSKGSEEAVARVGAEKGEGVSTGISKFDGEYGGTRYLLKVDGVAEAGAQVQNGQIIDFYKDSNSNLARIEDNMLARIAKDFGHVELSDYATADASKALKEKVVNLGQSAGPSLDI